LRGPTGLQGSATNTGATGPTGLRGATGTPGEASNTGATGDTGETGPTGPIGYGLGLTVQGLWTDGNTYTGAAPGTATGGTHIDAVTYNRSLYICITPEIVSTVPPNEDTANWQLLLQGDTGDTGPVGATGTVYASIGIWQGGSFVANTLAISPIDNHTYVSTTIISQTGTDPSINTAEWTLFSLGGSTGIQGPPGVDGYSTNTGAAGQVGDTGPVGATGTVYNSLGLWPGGSYVANTLAISLINNNTYVSIVPSISNIYSDPANNPTEWQLFLLGGTTGESGFSTNTGATGATGTVYTSIGLWEAGSYLPNTLAISPIDNNTYVCILVVENIEIDPSNNYTEWKLFVRGGTGPMGDTGTTGPMGDTGSGVPIGGNLGDILVKIDGEPYNTQWVTDIKFIPNISPSVWANSDPTTIGQAIDRMSALLSTLNVANIP
jgi:hypothetical protein